MNATAARAILLILPLAACGGADESPATADRTQACSANEANGTFAIDRRFDFEDETSMQQLADTCADAGCIKRETAICLFGLSQMESGWSGEAPRARVVRMNPTQGSPFLAWEVWSELTPADKAHSGYVAYGCTIDAMSGEALMCGGTSAPLAR